MKVLGTQDFSKHEEIDRILVVSQVLVYENQPINLAISLSGPFQ